MKKFLLTCLMAGCGQCFAQNLDLKDLQRVLESQVVEIINPLLAPKGYSFSGKTNTLQWGFKSTTNPDAASIAQVTLATDTSGIRVIYETANPFFYTNLLNQLPGNNFQFRQTTAADNDVNLVFSNGKQELLLDFVHDTNLDKPYRITLQPVNPLRSSLPQQYNHSIRKLTF